MEGFNESERKGLIGKIINYFDIGSPSFEPASQWGYNAMEKKQILLEYFKIEELKLIYNKINECENKTTFEKINPFLTNDKIEKIYNYLLSWKNSYWDGGDMSNFLCGMLGKIRERTKEEKTKALAIISDKTNPDISNLVKEYTGLGGKRYKIHRKSKKTKKTRKSKKSRK
jgi:hypothetical protein